MGDVLPTDALPAGVDAAKVKQAVDAAFDPPAALTAAVVVTWKGRIIAERYADGITAQTPLESWSMGKSVTASLMGVLIKQGVYDLWQPAPIPEWQNSPTIRARRSALPTSCACPVACESGRRRIPATMRPARIPIISISTRAVSIPSATPPLVRWQWPPNTVGRYRNTDPVLINYLVRLAVEKRGEEYLSFPQRALFDKIGIRTMVIEPDPFGNLLGHGSVFGSARDWARLGNLHLQDGVWNGERILPEGYVRFVSTLARHGSRQPADLRWLHLDQR